MPGLQAARRGLDDDIAKWSSNGRPVPPSLCLVDRLGERVSQASGAAQAARLGRGALGQRAGPVEQPGPGDARGEEDLRAKLQQQLGRKLASVPRRCQMAASGIPTLQDFGQLLPEMTMLMLKRFRKEATAHPPAGPVIERPRLRRADPMEPEIPDE